MFLHGKASLFASHHMLTPPLVTGTPALLPSQLLAFSRGCKKGCPTCCPWVREPTEMVNGVRHRRLWGTGLLRESSPHAQTTRCQSDRVKDSASRRVHSAGHRAIPRHG